MSSYFSRLLWISFASFFLVHLASGLLVWGIAPVAIRVAGRKRPASAARFVLAVRLFPCAFATFVMVALCVPSYLWLEPATASEDMSLACLVAAALCAAIWTISIVRSLRGVIRSARYVRHCRNAARQTRLPGYPGTGWIIPGSGDSIGLTGIFRPQVVIATSVLTALSREQLEAALRHEWAHAASRDNLKKLLLLVVPDVFPFVRTRFAELDRAWARFSEWAADDRAAAGDQRRSLSLAAALVNVARLGSPASTPLVTSFLADAWELSARIDRLLNSRPDSETAPWRMPLASVGIALVILFMAVGLGPSALHGVHELLETLVR